MLGSHDTFTYLKTNNLLAKTCTLFWRCQEISIQDQYKKGVRVFDVRVIHENSKGFNWWRIGHGFATVEQKFVNLKNICLYFKNEFPGSTIRICLESGCSDENILNRFKNEAAVIAEDFKDMLWTIIIKKPWTELYRFKTYTEEKDYCCHLFNWNNDQSIMYNLKHFDISSWNIKKWAQKHNPAFITKDMINDPNILYFMDYVGVYPKIK